VVKVYLDGELKKNVPVNLKIKIFDKVVVCTRNISREEVISFSDLALGKREISKINGIPLTNIEEAIGKVVKNRIKAQTVITKEMMQNPIIIRRRSIVNIILPFNNLHIATKGIAKKDGRKGEYILVQNIDTKKELYGEVIAPRTVKIGF
jgi:flagella basal body P-ring formation protein FlgA